MHKDAHILVVDDDPDTVEILSRQFGMENYKILKAYSGEESLELLKKHKPDLILMDLTMPGMDGFETIRIIKDTVKEFIPIIIITASKDDTENITRGFAVGASDYIVIPCNKEELLARIRAMLRIKELHDALRETNAYLDNLFNYANAPIIVWDPQCRITRFNHAFESLTGRTAGEVLGQTLGLLFPPAKMQLTMEFIQKTLKGERWQTVDIEILHHDGTIRTVLWNSATIFDAAGKTPIATIAQGHDITERKRSEERLEQVNRCLLSLGPDFTANINQITTLCGELMNGTCALYNRLEGGLLCALGQWHTPQDFIPEAKPEGHICYDVIGGVSGKDVLFVPDLLNSRYAETDINVRRYGLQSYLGHAVRCGSKAVGSLCVVFRHPYKPTENDKRLLGILASALSTEENRHEAEQKSAMLSDAIETAHHGCLIISEDYKVVFGNNYALTKLGFDSDELKNMDLFSLCADREQVKDIIETMKVTKRWMGEIMVTKKDGKQFPALVSVTALGADDDPSGRGGNIILFQDITIQKEMREKLLTSEKLAVMGRLTADVAHELNNPLAIVIGGTQLVLSRIDEKPSPFKSQLETILRNARRCKTILNNLLGYGRTIGKKEEAVNLPNLIREAIDDVNYQHDMSAIETVFNYSELAVAEITGNKSALLSVFVNLIRNARQAMGEKGRLTVTIEKEDAKHLRIEIHDTGIGMNTEQKSKLFKPFTSGWKEAEGSGLGLATSLGIIETHGGSMAAESEGVGKGATFTILLPCEFKGKK